MFYRKANIYRSDESPNFYRKGNTRWRRIQLEKSTASICIHLCVCVKAEELKGLIPEKNTDRDVEMALELQESRNEVFPRLVWV